MRWIYSFLYWISFIYSWLYTVTSKDLQNFFYLYEIPILSGYPKSGALIGWCNSWKKIYTLINSHCTQKLNINVILTFIQLVSAKACLNFYSLMNSEKDVSSHENHTVLSLKIWLWENWPQSLRPYLRTVFDGVFLLKLTPLHFSRLFSI